MTGNQISVPSVCGVSRLVGMGDGQGFMEKFKFLISLMDFIATIFHCVRQILPRFLPKLSFDTNLVEKPNFSDFEKKFGFCSHILVESI